MRIFFLIISILYCQLALSQSFEGRLIDMKFGIVSPEDGHYFKLPALVDVKINATNLGPDTLCEGDTIYYGFKISTQTRRLLVYIVNKKILPGESVIISDTITFNDRPSPPWTNNYGSTFFEIYWCFARNRQAGLCKPINIRYDQTNGRDLNNSDTNIINYTNAQSSVEYVHSDVQFYPSPFKQDLTVNAAYDIHYVVIRDITGREVYRHHAGGRRQLTLKPGTLKAGIYLLELTNIYGGKNAVKIIKENE